MNKQLKKWGLRGSTVGILALVTSVGVGMARRSAAPRPRAAVNTSNALLTVANWSNSLAVNTNGWCTFTICNGVQSPNTYGTIDMLHSTFSNYGGGATRVR